MNFDRNILLKAIKEIDNNPELRINRNSSTYDLIYNEKKYPPILVLSVANQLNNGKALFLNDFNNDVKEPFKILRDNGFEIQPKLLENKPNIEEFIKIANEQTTGQGTTKSAMHFARANKSEKDGLNIEISFGVGRASAIPWIAFTGFQQSVKDGIYPVYLYYKEYNLLVLAYGVSETNSPSINWKNTELEQNIKKYFEVNYSKKSIKYGSSIIYKVYDAKNLPAETILALDLEKLIALYKLQFTNNKILKPLKLKDDEFDINSFTGSILKLGLIFSEKLISRFVSSLLTKPFVLLTGLSGSGKTKIAQSFVKWICEDESQYKINVCP